MDSTGLVKNDSVGILLVLFAWRELKSLKVEAGLPGIVLDGEGTVAGASLVRNGDDVVLNPISLALLSRAHLRQSCSEAPIKSVSKFSLSASARVKL